VRIVVLLALALSSPAMVLARSLEGRLVRPLVLQLTGRFVPDRVHARAGGADALMIRVADRNRWFAAVLARTTGDAPVSGRTVLDALAPIEPNLIARGPEDLANRLGDARDGATVRMEGIVDRGSRTYLLRTVEIQTP
jgi:hypothetical protein